MTRRLSRSVLACPRRIGPRYPLERGWAAGGRASRETLPRLGGAWFKALGAILALLLSTGPARAFDRGVEAGVVVDRTQIKLDSGTELRISRAQLFLTERPRPGLILGLHGGPLLIGRRGDAATDGLEPSGAQIGVSARGELFRQSRFGVAGTLAYSYLRADDSDDDRELKISLHQSRIELATLLRLQTARFQVGAYGLHLDGDETLSGTLARNRTLAAKRSVGAFAQADLWVDYTGRVSLRVDGGAQQSATLSFGRMF